MFFCCQILSEHAPTESMYELIKYSLQLENILANKVDHDIFYALGLGMIGIACAQSRQFEKAKTFLLASINCNYQISTEIAKDTLGVMKQNGRIWEE